MELNMGTASRMMSKEAVDKNPPLVANNCTVTCLKNWNCQNQIINNKEKTMKFYIKALFLTLFD